MADPYTVKAFQAQHYMILSYRHGAVGPQTLFAVRDDASLICLHGDVADVHWDNVRRAARRMRHDPSVQSVSHPNGWTTAQLESA